MVVTYEHYPSSHQTICISNSLQEERYMGITNIFKLSTQGLNLGPPETYGTQHSTKTQHVMLCRDMFVSDTPNV